MLSAHVSDDRLVAPDMESSCHSIAPTDSSRASAAVIVAHPDDETLWAGGTILLHPQWDWFIVALCRGHDPDRAPRFHRALKRLGATGTMADLDDEPEQVPLAQREVQETVLSLLGNGSFKLLLTHGPRGEYTRHLRHEETSRAVAALWLDGKICADSLWMFAYEDGGKRYLPRAEKGAHLIEVLSEDLWRRKHEIIMETYGFAEKSFEAKTTPREEAFWRFNSPQELKEWLSKEGNRANESAGSI
jgi:LmbE family N-acetylglucosaminyl deacetylase